MKNKMMRAASVLMVAVLLSTCAISGTFAKYVTSDTAQDSARVAKWGITVDVFGNEAHKTSEVIFGEKYNDQVLAGGTQVISRGGDVLAPGTDGTLATIKITGQAEVALAIEAKVDLELANWTASGNYFPVVIKVNDTAVTYNTTDDAEVIEAAVEKAIIKAINDAAAATEGTGMKGTTNYDANHEFGDAGFADDVTVTWAWEYEGNDDVKDTILGDAATAATISINYTVTATQLN